MCERTKDDFTTVYRKTFTRKYIRRPERIITEPEYKDILSGPFTEYILPDNGEEHLEHPFEYATPYYNKLLKEHPKLKRYLDTDPDPAVVAWMYKDKSKTTYMVDYCNDAAGFESKKTLARRRMSLPADWGEIPATTQRASYRNPYRLATWDLVQKPARPPPASLDPNVKERAILQVKTGQSEYEGRIGTLGEMIIKDELHGPPRQERQCDIYREMMKKCNKLEE